MIMLHILAGILKIAGILLAVLVGIFLLLLLSLLFVPVVYRGNGEKDGQEMNGAMKISWLFHIISFKVWYQQEETHCSIRVFGIPIEKIQKVLKKFLNRSVQKEPKELTAAQERRQKTENTAGRPAKEAIQEEVSAIKEEETESMKSETRDVFQSFRNFGLTLKGIYVKIKKIKKVLESDQVDRTRRWIVKEIKALFFHIKPKKLKGNIKFGTEDPCLTGEILAAAGIFYPLYGEYFTIEPFFEKKLFEGELYFQGRIYSIYFALLAWRIFRNRDIRYIIKKFKYI